MTDNSAYHAEVKMRGGRGALILQVGAPAAVVIELYSLAGTRVGGPLRAHVGPSETRLVLPRLGPGVYFVSAQMPGRRPGVQQVRLVLLP
jgi:hypothetical protein